MEVLMKTISEGCVEFYDVVTKISLNLVPFGKTPFLPRLGEIISLPSSKGLSEYDVMEVTYVFKKEEPTYEGAEPEEASLNKVSVHVKPAHTGHKPPKRA
jgi:hypothetical protein